MGKHDLSAPYNIMMYSIMSIFTSHLLVFSASFFPSRRGREALVTSCSVLVEIPILTEGGNEGGRKATPTPTSTSIFDFYGIKALLFEFGNNILTGFKMPRL